MPEETLQRKSNAVARVARDPVSRRRFMALGGGGAAAAFLAACGGGSDSTTTMGTNASDPMSGSGSATGGESETAQFGKGDIGILNYALTLEYLETAFYEDVAKSGLFKGAELATIKKFGAEEAQHVAALRATVQKMGGN